MKYDSKTDPNRRPRGSHPRLNSVGQRGFSLVELLVVVGIMSILATITTLSVTGIKTSGNANNAILTIGAFIDQCRQYALANNTYVYVGIYQNPATSGAASEVWLAAVASSDGTDISSGGQSSITVGTNARAITKLVRLSGVDLQSAIQSQFATTANWTVPSGVADISQPGTTTIGPLGAANTKLPVTFYFSPDGAASTNGTVSTCLAFGIEVTAGSSSSHHRNPAVFQIAGLTGLTKIYRQ
jgi:prepilin-type N-terminal cleavage/methylation domain-containing protein